MMATAPPRPVRVWRRRRFWVAAILIVLAMATGSAAWALFWITAILLVYWRWESIVRWSVRNDPPDFRPAAPIPVERPEAAHRASHMPDHGEVPLIEAEGNGGHVWVFPNKIRIKHFGARGLISKGFYKGDKEIWIDQIAGIQWREPGHAWLGHIQFEVVGGASSTRVASQDENAVMFERSRREAFAAVKLKVEELAQDARRGRTTPSGSPDVPDQLRKLADLCDQGVLTPQEFEEKKAELLARM
jgi:hypothetical protein